MNDLLTNLIINGFCITTAPYIIDGIDTSSISWVKKPELGVIYLPDDQIALDPILDHLQKELGEKLLLPMFGSYKMGQRSLWMNQDLESQDPGSIVWHNDDKEGSNLFALVYFTTILPENGGSINFKNSQGEEFKHYPVRGDCALVSMKRGFHHRVEHINGTHNRIVVNFAYNVPIL